MRSSRLSTSRRTLPAVSQRVTLVRRTRREDDEEDVSDACVARVNIEDGARVDANMVTRERVAINPPPTDFYVLFDYNYMSTGTLVHA